MDRPKGLPSGFPLPEGAHLLRTEATDGVVRSSFVAPQGCDLRAFFGAVLAPTGWAVVPSQDDDDSVEIEGHGFFGEIEFHGEACFTVQLVD